MADDHQIVQLPIEVKELVKIVVKRADVAFSKAFTIIFLSFDILGLGIWESIFGISWDFCKH